jgi:outer membrane protein TolC
MLGGRLCAAREALFVMTPRSSAPAVAPWRPLAVVCVTLATSLVPRPAAAIQPLDAFLRRAATANPDNREARAGVEQRDAEARAALARLLPSVSLRGSYTRNQYEVITALGPGVDLVIQPGNQWDAALQLDVPLVDLSTRARIASARAGTEAAAAGHELTALEIQKQIARTYHGLLGAEALRQAAARSLDAARANEKTVLARKEGGVSTDLDAQRARANAARAEQDVADADLVATLGRRSLETLSGLTPEPGGEVAADDLHEEAPLSSWVEGAAESPSVRVSLAQSRAVDEGRRAARLAFLPTLSASAQERLTNATGFTGKNANYTLSLTASWRFDFGLAPSQKAQEAALEGALAREEKSRRGAADQVHEAWHRVRAGLARSRAARAQASAAEQASRLASERYAAGAATQLDVIQAQRDAFSARVGLAQADADLAAARALLRLSAGRPLASSPAPALPPSPATPSTSAAPPPAPTPTPPPAPPSTVPPPPAAPAKKP